MGSRLKKYAVITIFGGMETVLAKQRASYCGELKQRLCQETTGESGYAATSGEKAGFALGG